MQIQNIRDLKIVLTASFILNSLLMMSQVTTNLKTESVQISGIDSIVEASKPDADRDDIPFIDYVPAIIWKSQKDTLHSFGYIRKNFTDQLLSVWEPSRRYYPASRIYAASLNGTYYRTVKVSPQNYVFAQQMLKGDINLFMYRKIPQVNGWVEYVSADANNPGYTNFMIVEQSGMRGSRNQFGYYYTTIKDSSALVPIQKSNLAEFAKVNLSNTPLAYQEAMKYGKKNKTRIVADLVIGVMTASMVASVVSGNDHTWIFLAGFPLMAVAVWIGHPHTLHWEDMVRIIEMHNKEISTK